VPAKPAWLLRIPEIITQLQALTVPVVDRASCERLFGVKRRRAIDLMQSFGGYRSGNTVLVDRADLITRLAEIARTDDYVRESTRKQRLAADLQTSHVTRKAATIVLPVTTRAADRNMNDLPAGVILARGKLVVEFSDPEEMLAKLYELAQVAANDFDRLCNALAR
jgi:hypothetical protein